MVGTYSMDGLNEIFIHFLNMNGRGHLACLGIGGRIIIKGFLEKKDL